MVIKANTYPFGLWICEEYHGERECHAAREEDPHPPVHLAIHWQGGILRRKANTHRENVGDSVASGS